MGFPFVCCDYVSLPLVKKGAALTYGRAEYSKEEIQAETEDERRRSQRNTMQLPKK